MRLFSLENYEIIIEPYALMIKDFKPLLSNDQEKTKQQLSFLFFFDDPCSDFQTILDPDDRAKAIKEAIGLPEQWDYKHPLIQKALSRYHSFSTPAEELLRAAIIGVEKIKEQLIKTNLDEKDKTGKPQVKMQEYLHVLKQIPQVATQLAMAEEKIREDKKTRERSSATARGNIPKTVFDDGIDIK